MGAFKIHEMFDLILSLGHSLGSGGCQIIELVKEGLIKHLF